MYAFLFLVPKNGAYLQVGYCPTTGASVISIDAEVAKWVGEFDICRAAQSYSMAWLKQLGLRVWDLMQKNTDDELSFHSIIIEAMDIIDMEIAAEQREIDAAAIDQWEEQRGELSMS